MEEAGTSTPENDSESLNLKTSDADGRGRGIVLNAPCPRPHGRDDSESRTDLESEPSHPPFGGCRLPLPSSTVQWQGRQMAISKELQSIIENLADAVGLSAGANLLIIAILVLSLVKKGLLTPDDVRQFLVLIEEEIPRRKSDIAYVSAFSARIRALILDQLATVSDCKTTEVDGLR